MSLRLLRAGERTHLRELAHAGQEGESDVGVAVLDDRIDAAQEIAVRAGDLRQFEGVQNRLVVLVDQHRDPLSGLLVQQLQEMSESLGRRDVGPKPPPSGARTASS